MFMYRKQRSRKRLSFLLSFLTLLFPLLTHAATIWDASDTPSRPEVNDGVPIEVGTKFQTDVDGSISALRFYKGAANAGTHVGHLWTGTGTLLATATFTGETASGWQDVQLSPPVAIQANTTYVVSYHSSSGYFAMTERYFLASDVYNPPLRALATGVDGGNGVYREGESGFPNQTWNGNNYWVDVVFSPNGTGDITAPTVTSFTMPTTATSLTVPITSFTATDNVGVTGYLVSESPAVPSPTAGDWAATTQTAYTFAAAGSKTLYAWAKDAAGNVSASTNATVTITIGEPTRNTIWTTADTPSRAEVNDGNPIEIGVKFQADVAGFITALRFYKGAANTGAHVGSLWSGTGTLLASVAFTGESASGWQEMQLAAPVAIQAGTTYVASYHSASGYFAMNEGYFTADVYNPPLRALATGVDGGNGVYKNGDRGFPTETWNGNNYWVDVVFSPNATGDNTAPTVASFTVPTTATDLTVPILNFTATDNVGVTGYLVTESATAPAPTTPGWSAAPQTSYTFSTSGDKTLYAWAKDAADNVSEGLSATVTVTPVDTISPTVTVFTVPATANSLTVPITGFTATDNVEVTGYLVTESATAPAPTDPGWSATAQTSYTFATAGSKTLYAWAKDAAGNISVSLSAAVTVTGSEPSLYSIWTNAVVPSQPAETDDQPLELGVKFQADVDGVITALRFYKGAANTGTHVGNLWTRTGTLLASATFAGETASGWQEVQLSAPVAIQAGTTYIASYHSSSGYFAMNEAYFVTNDYTPPLQALANGVDGGNGVYKYGASGFPTETWNANNYWVDVVFRKNGGEPFPPTVTAFTVPATADSLTVPITAFTATGGTPEVTGYLVNESSVMPSPNAADWSATPQTSYTFATTGSKTLYAWAKDAAGNVSTSASASVTVTTGGDIIAPTVITFTVPATADSFDVPITAFAATDNVGVTGYLVNESAAAPLSTAAGWSATPQTSYTFATTGSKTLYAWARDAVGNVSESLSAAVAVTIVDTVSPTVTLFTVPATTDSLTVPITGFTATDDVGVTGYLVNEAAAAPSPTAAGWSATTQTSYTCATAGSKTLYAWAKDSAGNVSASLSAAVTITTGGEPFNSIWSNASAPSRAAVSDGQPLEVGVKFQSDVDGIITTLRFYKGMENTGTHIGHLWSRTGTLLASVTFANETASGWQEAQLAIPVAIQAGTTYVASYHSSSGYFALDEGFFTADIYNPPLRALANGVDGGNGVYKYGESSFPTETWNGNNYWVDVVFSATGIGDTAPPIVASFIVPTTETSLTVPITVFSATDNVGVTGYLVTEASAVPSPSAAGWSTTPQTSYAFASAGDKTLYAWAKDAAGNVSESLSAVVSVIPVDSIAPTVTAFTVPATADSLTVPITTLTASDNASVTGYLVTEAATVPLPTDTGWSATAQTAFTFASEGSKTLYAWAKDQAGNVSASLSAAVTITLFDTTPPTLTAFIVPATADSLTVPITGFTATDNVEVTGYLVTESATAPSPAAAGWSATAPISYTFATAGSKTLYAWAKDGAGNISASLSGAVTVTATDIRYSIWTPTTVPNLAAVSDGLPMELGVKFQADVDGSITALRFYKGAENTGVHIGNLWSSTGTLLASATYANETTSGWQEVQLATPVAIQAGATYVASYHSPSGYFAINENYFTTEISNPPLRALASGASGGNGVYRSGESSFPTATWNANNYWVDVVFRP